MTASAPPKNKPPPPTRGKAPAQHIAARTAPAALAKLEPTFQPPRIVLNAVEGWGKTSCGAYAPEAAILMARGDSGYRTLLGGNRVPNIPAAEVESWSDLLALLDMQTAGDSTVKTLVLDAIGGFERLCHEHVCARDFKGLWGNDGFAAYAKGYDMAVGDWLQLLARLDQIRAHGVTIILLSHCQVKAFRNPLGEDYDRYVSDVHAKTFAATHRWADAVFFGKFHTVIDHREGRPKGIGGTDRILYTEHRDAYDAKNRFGMTPEVEIPDDPSQIWPTIWAAITGKEHN